MATSLEPSEPAARLSCRIHPDIKRQAEEAASLLGQSITDFTEAALAEKAAAVFAHVDRIRLSERDFETFVEAITHASPPTPELVRAAADYRRLCKDEPEGNW